MTGTELKEASGISANVLESMEKGIGSIRQY